jgi:hypothetical protein
MIFYRTKNRIDLASVKVVVSLSRNCIDDEMYNYFGIHLNLPFVPLLI